MPSTVGGAAGQPGGSSTGGHDCGGGFGLDKLDRRGFWSRQARPAGVLVSTSSTGGDQELDELEESEPDELEESDEVDEVVDDGVDEVLDGGVLLLDDERLSVR